MRDHRPNTASAALLVRLLLLDAELESLKLYDALLQCSLVGCVELDHLCVQPACVLIIGTSLPSTPLYILKLQVTRVGEEVSFTSLFLVCEGMV